MKKGFVADKWVDTSIIDNEYYLHTHTDKHEILLFLDGDCEFHVEGNVYKLSPYDMVIASTNELHRIVHKSEQRYERYIIYIDTDFFAKNGCPQFSAIFENKTAGKYNFFSGEFVKESGISELIEKICLYSSEGEDLVSKGVLFELLYKIKKGTQIENQNEYNSGYINNVVSYINENLTSELSLNSLAERFHISSSYLSRLFKKQMKMTLTSYISYKRLIYAKQLHKSGKSLLDSCMESGFSSYTNFYRMYIKEFGKAPSKKE